MDTSLPSPSRHHHNPGKQIVFVSAEATPFSKTGGLGDVAGELPAALAQQGHQVLVLTPWYGDLNQSAGKPEFFKEISVPFDNKMEPVSIGVAQHHGITYGFVGHDMFSQTKLMGYDDYHSKRFALLDAAMPFVANALGFSQPDIVHAHDWHAGLVPAILKHRTDLPEGFTDKVKSVFTIHNAGYQGAANIDDVLAWTGLPESLRQSPLNNHGVANSMTAGSGFADAVTTVSPSYATELRRNIYNPELELAKLYPVKGIINGIGEDWNPSKAQDHKPFSADDLSGKQETKNALCAEFGITDASKPTLGLVSRIARGQKGIDVFLDSVDALIAQGWNIIVAGNGDADLEAALAAKAEQHAGQMAYHRGFSKSDMTHRIIAGSDAFAIPSRYEPCGITQLQSMACGTLPIATETGGLKDTIADSRTGFLFAPEKRKDGPVPTAEGLCAAAQRAIDIFRNDPKKWHGMVQDAMAEDNSWRKIASDYVALYDAVQERQANPQLQQLRDQYPPSKNNTALRCYNMFPRQYDDLEAMAQDVPRIAKMGFNAVWVNPLAQPGKIEQPDWSQYQGNFLLPSATLPEKTGSIYSQYDLNALNPEFSKSKGAPDQERDDAAIRKLTGNIGKHHMAALCDVAFSHIALDSPLVAGTAGIVDAHGAPIDTTRWFKHYDTGANQGKPVRHGVGPDNQVSSSPEDPGKPHTKMVWADIAMFNYDDPQIRKEIIDHLWKPYMDRLAGLGFTGMRVDSISQNNSQVLQEAIGYFKEKVCAAHPRTRPEQIFILGETLGQSIDEYKRTDLLTHAYSSAFWTPTMQEDPAKATAFWEAQHAGGSNFLSHEMGRMEAEVIRGMADRSSPKMVGGAIGYPGSHDEQPITLDCVKPGYRIDYAKHEVTGPDGLIRPVTPQNITEYVDVPHAERAMREKMAQTMLIPNGGYFLFAGDEYAQIGPRSVFSDHTKAMPLVDLSEYVADINRITANLTPPQPGAWATRRCIENPDLAVIERHPYGGLNGITDLIVLNISPDKKHIELTPKDIEAIASEVRITSDDKNSFGRKARPDELAAAMAHAALPGATAQPAMLNVHFDRSIGVSQEVIQSVEPAPETRIPRPHTAHAARVASPLDAMSR